MSRCIPPSPPKPSPLLRPRARPNSLLEQVQRRVSARRPERRERLRIRLSAMPPAPPRSYRFATRPAVMRPLAPEPAIIELTDDEIIVVDAAPAAHLLAWCDGSRRSSFASSPACAPVVRPPALALESREQQLEALHVDSLQALNPVRADERGEQLSLTIAHPLLRTSARALLPEQRGHAHHTALAQAHFEHKDGREEAGARHLVALGRLDRAAEPFANAGYEALSALAFDRAALMYAEAVRCSPHDRVPRIRLAEALALAGHATESGRHFLMVARVSKKARRVELITRGVEQLIYGGELVAASKTLRGLLAELGVEYPESDARAAQLLELELERLSAHSLEYREHNSFELGSQLLAELALFRTVGKALLPVDPARGGYLIVRGALTALLSGEPRSIAYTLALVGLLLSGDNASLARRFLGRAERVASEVCDRYAQGLTSLARGALAYHEASWLEALGQYDNARELLRAQPQTTRWDRSMIDAGQRATLAASAEIQALNQERGELTHAANLHDRLRHGYAEVTRLLARDRPDEARAHIDGLLAREPEATRERAVALTGSLTMLCDLYVGQVREDWSELCMLALQEESHTGIRDFRLDLVTTRVLLGRVALVRAVREHPSRARLLRLVSAVVSALETNGAPALQGEAALLRAGQRNLGGDIVGAIEHLRDAAQRFLEAGAELHLACAWRRLGGLLGNAEGDALIERAERVFAREGVHNTRRWVQLNTPALSSAQSGRLRD